MRSPPRSTDRFRSGITLLPALYFGLPQILFISGISLFMGERFRKPVLIFFFPVAMMLAAIFFFWDWSPSWLTPFWNKVLMFCDPAGFRWLNETWLKTDRGVAFYNSSPIGLDAVFISNRLTLVLGSILLLHVDHSAFRGDSTWCASTRAPNLSPVIPNQIQSTPSNMTPLRLASNEFVTSRVLAFHVEHVPG